MCSLSQFQVPPPVGFVTICEENGELVAAKFGETQYSNHLQSLCYPDVNISKEHAHHSVARESARSAFLEHEDTLSQRLFNAWHEEGLAGILQEVAHKKGNNVPSLLSTIARQLLATVRWFNNLQGSIFPHHGLSKEAMLDQFSGCLDWKTGPVRCVVWHPHTAKFAVASHDDTVKVYTVAKSDIIPTLKHKQQKYVADLAWKPFSASVLAVACQACILIWHVDPVSLATRPSSSSVQVLSQSGHEPVSSLCWDPKGGILLSASPADTSVMAWDVALETCVPLRRVGGGGVSQMRWSPDGAKMFSACPGSIFRVWETHTWNCEKWSQLSGHVQAACWSPDGNILLFTTTGEPTIFSLTFTQPKQTGSTIGGSRVAVGCVDLSEVLIDSGEGKISVGGLVQNMIWDPTGERLAVQFKGNSNEFIALFQTRLYPMLELMPCGFVRGEPGLVPHLITFQPNFDKGALLTVVWSSGKLSYVPLYFLASSHLDHRRLHQQADLNGHLHHTSILSEH